MEVTVMDAGQPVASARVCIYTDDFTVYDVAMTNAFGVATLHPEAAAPGDLNVKIVGHDLLEYTGSVPILPPEGPYLVYDASLVLDADGDADGMLDEGETVGLDVSIENVGVDPTSGVVVTLGCEDPYVTILEAVQDYPNIPAGDFGTCLLPFSIFVAGDVPDGHLIQFSIDISANEGSWDAGFYHSAQAPVLSTGSLTVIDLPYGDGSGNADAGETVTLRVELVNTGHSAADMLTASIGCMDFNIVITDATGECAHVPVGGDGTVSSFIVEVLPGCPEPYGVEFALYVEDSMGFSANLGFELPVGGWFDDFEIDRGWTIGAAGDDASTGIWTRVDPIGTEYNGVPIQTEDDHTPAPGTMCFVTGQGSVGGSVGENDVDGGTTTLLSPVFDLAGATEASLSYWRWYTEDKGTNAGDDFWDVDVTSNGITWVSLEHTNVSEEVWVQKSFELADFIALTGNVQLRFIASDEGVNSLMEAAVDDVLLNTFIPLATEVDDAAVPARLALGRNFPNPFNPKTTLHFALPSAGKVELAIYDVSGRRVTTLAQGVMEAGYHELDWLGTDDSGHSVSSGIYFSRLIFGEEVLTEKMLMLK